MVLRWYCLEIFTWAQANFTQARPRCGYATVHEEAYTNERCISFDGHQLYAFNMECRLCQNKRNLEGYDSCWYLRRMMMVFMINAGIYYSCWYLHFMLVFTTQAGIYDLCWYLRRKLVFTTQAGIYDACWYLRRMLVFTTLACIYDKCWYLHFMLVFTTHAGIYYNYMHAGVYDSC